MCPFNSYPVLTLPTLKETVGRNYEALATALRGELDEPQIEQIYKVICNMPSYHIDLYVRGCFGDQLDVQKRLEKQCTKDDWMDIHTGQVRLLSNIALNISLISNPFLLILGVHSSGGHVSLRQDDLQIHS